ncbi:hypothetical protein BH11PSE2_BH11PSE2_05460 [soil metagenome]
MRPLRLAALCLVLLLAACARPEIVYDGKVFEAKGWRGPEPAAGWQSVLTVYASPDPAMPPMAGRYERIGSRLLFFPAFPPTSGVRLRVVYSPTGAPQMVRVFHSRAKVAPSRTMVAAVYPTSDTLPANQLKFYVVFSRPMSRGQAWDHVRLIDDKGRKIDQAFAEIDEELWDPQGRRLTILFNPGRLKRGVEPNLDQGPPLVAGRRYSLDIDPAWKDAQGARLKAGYSKGFTVAPAERRPIALGDWRLTVPPAGGKLPLVVSFPRPLDEALLQHALHVRSGDVELVGKVTLDGAETHWSFVPAKAWVKGDYQLRVDTTLEDLAGNRIGRAFDVDLDTDTQPRIIRDFETRPFRIVK